MMMHSCPETSPKKKATLGTGRHDGAVQDTGQEIKAESTIERSLQQ